MLAKDFENFELKLMKLKQESLESFKVAEKSFDDNYLSRLEDVFPRDVLGAKKLIKGSFLIAHVDCLLAGETPDVKTIFETSLKTVVASLPLSGERKQSLINNILTYSQLPESLQSYFSANDTISRDPFFALVEDFSIDGDISKEEFLLLEQSYQGEGNFLKALEVLPDNIKKLFHGHIEMTLSNDVNSKRSEFESEFSTELKALSEKGINIEPVIAFVSKSFYKTPGKYRKFEHPKRRMRRTFKIAFLKLLRAKLGNIDAQLLLDRFESGESFEDFFMLLFKLLEVVNEDPNSQEIYSILKLDEEIQDDVFTAEENKEKILAGESLVMKIASLFSKGEAKGDEAILDDGLLDKILDENTDIVGEDIYFNREEENAGIFAESDNDYQEDDEDELDYDTLSPEVAYEMLEHQFHTLEEEKRKAFLSGDYDSIDIYNEKLLLIESKLGKLCKVLGIET